MSEHWTKPKPITPPSLKVLITVQGLAILLLASWLFAEYQYAPTFRNVLNDVVFSRALTWAATIGLFTGLVGSLAALGLHRGSERLREKVESLQTALAEASKKLQDKLPTPSLSEMAREQGGPLARVQTEPTSLLVLSKNP